MKLYSLAIVLTPGGAENRASVLSSAKELSSFSFFARASVAELFDFMACLIADRVAKQHQPGQRSSLQHEDYTAHVYNPGAPEHLVVVAITDGEYPVRPAFSILNLVFHDFRSKISWKHDNIWRIPFPELAQYLEKYQDPHQIDPILLIQRELDETKVIVHKVVESVLARGEDLDKIVERSENLSMMSKYFYKTAKKQNSCCIIA